MTTRGAGMTRPLRTLVTLLVLAVAGFPLYWMLVTAFTPSAALFAARPQLLPSPAEIGNFVEAIRSIPIGLWLSNSAIIAAGTTALCLALAIFPAYAMSRFRFRGRGAIGLALFATQMLPEAMLVVPLFALYSQVGLINTLLGLILANTAFTVPVITWMLKGAIDGVPIEIEEAARIDGCSRVRIVLAVVLPLVAPSLAATAVIAFFNGWNEYILATTFITQEALRPASVGLASFVGQLSTPIHSVMAVALIYTAPAVVFYLFVQRYVVAGMTAGSVKG